MFTIRKAGLSDLPEMMVAYRNAREYMVSSGNPNQWREGFPTEDFIRNEIIRGFSYVVIGDSNEIEGAFSMIPGTDPTYIHIYNGKWINDEPYCTIHKLASRQRQKGLFKAVIAYASERYDNVRADTHKDNKTMQHLLLAAGFRYTGIIYLLNGEPRMAYHLVVR